MIGRRGWLGVALILCLAAAGCTAARSGDPPLPRDRVHWRLSPEGQPYLLYVPGTARPGGPVLVAVHGVTRNPEQHVAAFAEEAHEHGVVLVAPLFDRVRFEGYQRLGIGDPERADQYLYRLLQEIASLTGARTEQVFLFGHSGGAQFVHRYAMLHPERVAGYVASAAGWYTLPDPKVDFPYGVAPGPYSVKVELEPWLRVPACVLVGENDVHDQRVRHSAWLDEVEGETRRERAQSWARAMRKAARQRGLSTRYRLYLLPDTGHAFTGAVKRGHVDLAVFDCLFHEVPEFPYPRQDTQAAASPP